MLRRRFPGGIQLSQDAYDTGPIRWPSRLPSAANRPLRRHPATRRTRWLWLVPLLAGLVAVLGMVIARDPGPGLSGRGWFTLALAALLAVLLAIHRNAGQLLRAVAEYLVVALLAVLLATATGIQPARAPAKHPPSHAGATAKTAVDACPSIVHVRDWLTCLWNASQKAQRRSHPATTTKPTPKGHAMTPTPTPPSPSRRTHELV
jgi:hypothetical protein